MYMVKSVFLQPLRFLLILIECLRRPRQAVSLWRLIRRGAREETQDEVAAALEAIDLKRIPAQTTYVTIFILLSHPRYDLAMPLLCEMLVRYRHSEGARRLIELIASGAKIFEGSSYILVEHMVRHPEARNSLSSSIAYVCTLEGRYEEAAEWFEVASAAAPWSPSIWHDWIVMEIHRERYGKAAQLLEQAKSLAPEALKWLEPEWRTYLEKITDAIGRERSLYRKTMNGENNRGEGPG